MGSFSELSKLTAAGDVRLVHAIGVPRSMSTAFCRAINEAKTDSIYINEPFNRANDDVDQAARFVMEAMREHAVVARPAELIIVKNMASYLDADSFQEFASISAGHIWNIRHPLRQLESLVTRLANDLVIGPGANKLTPDEVYGHLGLVCDFLMDGPKSKDFSKTGWESIGRLFDTADSDHIVVDGEAFSTQPSASLQRVCTSLAIPFSNNMIDDWSETFTNVINHHDMYETERSAWTKEASTLTGVMPVERSGLQLDKIPRNLRDHITSIALPVYVKLAGANA